MRTWILLFSSGAALAACGNASKSTGGSGSGSGSGSAGSLAPVAAGSGLAGLEGPGAKPDLDAAAKAMMLPAPAATVPAAELAAEHSCGPLKTKDLAAKDVKLLDDRVRVRFLPGAQLAGTVESAKATVERGGVTAFVGAREMFFLADSAFPQKATKQASFAGDYDPVSIPARGGAQIVAGLLKVAPTSPDVVSLAHGWFLDGGSNVLDVAVFVSGVTAQNLAACRLFAQKVLSTAAVGGRTLAYGTGAAVETNVEYATFNYVLPAGWILASSWGTHDMIRLTFRKRGAYPDRFTEVQLARDSHPGDWATQGKPDGTRSGLLFGVPVTWNLTQADYSGAWTISKDLVQRDHAVGAIIAADPLDREEALRFAESIRTK